MEIKVIEFGPLTLIGLHADFYGGMSPKFNGQEVLGPLWSKVFDKLSELGMPFGQMIGATGFAESGEDGLLNQFVGLVVEQVPSELNGLEVMQLPKVRLAATEHVGSMATFMQTIGEFYSEALPKSGLQTLMPERFEFEIYGPEYNPRDPNARMSLGVVVA